MKNKKYLYFTLLIPLAAFACFVKPQIQEILASELPSENDMARMQTMTLFGDSSTTMAFNWNTTFYNDTDLEIIPKDGSFAGDNVLRFKGSVEKSKAANDTYIHRVVATNLTPNSEYEYRFGDREIGAWCETGSFKTSSIEKANFDFVHISDPQGWQTNHYEQYGKLLKVMRDKINPDFVALTGDIVNNSTTAPALDQWEMALSNQFDVFKDYPVAPVAGNHETAAYDFSSRFNLNHPEAPDLSSGDYYTFDYEGVHFIGLNTNDTHGSTNPNDATGLSDAQINWLEEDLKQHQSDKMRIVLMHKGIFDSGTHSSNMGEMQDYDIKYIREQCAPLFSKYNVSLVLQGHDHLYSLSEPTIAKVDNGQYSYDIDTNCKVENKTYDGEEIPTYTNLSGTFYLNSGTASGSKFYVPVLETIPEIHIQRTENPGTRMLSHILIRENTIIVKSYKVEGQQLNLLYQFAFEVSQSPVNPSGPNIGLILAIVIPSSIGGLLLIGGGIFLTIFLIKRKKEK